MFRTLAAGAKLEICLRCEARFLLARPVSRSVSSSLRRPQLSQETDIDKFSDLSNIPNTAASSNSANDGKKLEEEPSSNSNKKKNSTLSQSGDSEVNTKSHGATRLQKYKGHRKIPLNGNLISDSGHAERHGNGLEYDRSQDKYPGWRHPDIASDRVELGVERLGEPATIRVLPEGIDRGNRRRNRAHGKISSKKQDQKPKQAASTPLDTLVETVDSKNDGIAGHAEAFNNIEILRKAFYSNINQIEGASEAECRELGRSLERGFTKSQLQSYSKLAMTMKLPEVDRLDSPLISERYQVSRWYIGPSRWLHNFMKPELHFTTSSMKDYYTICHTGEKDKLGFPVETPSQREVNRILRLCWGLRTREEKLQKGSVALRIDQDWIAMLLQQEKTVFYQVAKLFRVKTKIDTRGLVIISGNYDACVDAVRVIASEVAAARMEQIALVGGGLSTSSASVQAAALRDIVTSTQKFWDQVGQQTQTRIVPVDLESNGSYRKVNVFYRPGNPKSLPGIQRWITHIQKILKQGHIPYQTIPDSKQTSPSLVPIPITPSMALIDQHSHWYRWRSLPSVPTSKKTGSGASTTRKDSGLPHAKGLQSTQVSDKLSDSWDRIRKHAYKVVKSPAFDSEHWESLPRTSLKAMFGHLVHAIPDRKLSVLQKSIDSAQTIKGVEPVAVGRIVQQLFSFRRILTTGIPSLMDTLSGLVLDKPAVSSFFRINLAPSSVTGFQSLSAWNAPLLEIDVAIDESAKTTSLHQVRLVLDREHVDLALPELAVDTRFTADTLMLGREDSWDPAISNFLKDCDLNVWGTGQFRTPPTLTLTLPAGVLLLSTNWAQSEISLTKSSQASNAGGIDSSGKIVEDVEKRSKTSGFLPSDLEAVTMQDMHINHPIEAADHKNSVAENNTTDDDEKEQTYLSSTTVTSFPPDRQPVPSAEQAAAQQVQVVYTFDSLAVHSVVQSSYQASTLSFSTIEAGQIGGKQQVLQMEAPGIADTLVRGEGRPRESLDVMKAKFMTFYGSICDFVGRLPR